MRSTLLLLCALFLACGPVPVDETLHAANSLTAAGRCTVDNLPSGWECCEEDGLLCSASGPVVCHAHVWEDLGVSECERIAADPRRPELRTYGNFCQMRWCQPRAHAQ